MDAYKITNGSLGATSEYRNALRSGTVLRISELSILVGFLHSELNVNIGSFNVPSTVS